MIKYVHPRNVQVENILSNCCELWLYLQ